MFHRAAALLFLCAAGVAAPALSQTAPNPTQLPAAVVQDEVPVFRMTVVGRTLPAINYRPRSGDTRINFAGTALLPNAKGWATISGEDGYIKVEAKFDNLEPPGRYGVEYVTYVLWAITPEGRATNLGEIQYDGDDADVEVTTELQSFGLIVTAEPYFAVTQPSDVVVIENVVRTGGFERTQGRVEAIEAKYELLKRGSYLMNQEAARAKIRAPEPGVSLDLAQARNAVAIARVARADQYAEETFGKAERLLSEAEQAREKRRRGNAIMQPARQAVQTAEDARIIALQRQEKEFLAEQRAAAEQARQRAQAEEERRRQAELSAREEEARRREAELAAQAEELKRRQAEAAAQSAAATAQAEEARRRQAELDAQAAAAAKAAAERQLVEAEATRLAAESARQQAEAERQRAEAARLAAEQQAAQAREAAEASEQEKTQLRESLRRQLNEVLETRETARGLIVNISDVLFDFDSATLRPGARERLARVAGILMSTPGLRINVEGHTDSVGTDGYNQRLSEARAASVRDYVVRNGIQSGTVGTAGFGESQPVATNGTSAGRQQNRRVELVVSGEIIDR
jgi:outer membrane protein OmpA-like peptidoglycan-associated protein